MVYHLTIFTSNPFLPESNLKAPNHLELEDNQKDVVNEMMLEFPKQNKEICHLLQDHVFLDHLKVFFFFIILNFFFVFFKDVDHYFGMQIKDYKKKIEYGDPEYVLIQNCSKYSNIIDKE